MNMAATIRLHLSLILLLGLGFSSPAQAIFCRNLFPSTVATNSASQSPSQALKFLAEKDYLLEQSAEFLPKDYCGGTCGATSATNVLLSFVEAAKPGMVSQLPPKNSFGFRRRPNLQQLQERILKTFIQRAQRDLNEDITKGINLKDLQTMIETVASKLFPDTLMNLSAYRFSRHLYLSLHPSSSSIPILFVQSNSRLHAVMIERIVPINSPRKETVGPAFWEATIRDPHRPEVAKTRRIYEKNGEFYLEAYGPKENAHYFKEPGSSKTVKAGQVITSLIVTQGNIPATRNWSHKDVMEISKNEDFGFAHLHLKNGIVLEVIIPFNRKPSSPEELSFYHNHGAKLDSIPFNMIADIQRLQVN